MQVIMLEEKVHTMSLIFGAAIFPLYNVESSTYGGRLYENKKQIYWPALGDRQHP
jgi:hypothetical protein